MMIYYDHDDSMMICFARCTTIYFDDDDDDDDDDVPCYTIIHHDTTWENIKYCGIICNAIKWDTIWQYDLL